MQRSTSAGRPSRRLSHAYDYIPIVQKAMVPELPATREDPAGDQGIHAGAALVHRADAALLELRATQQKMCGFGGLYKHEEPEGLQWDPNLAKADKALCQLRATVNEMRALFGAEQSVLKR
mmetsp:Transcript_74816/g.241913  ORF Transcript_74816/g.241913 Transcript_74816/m.241913 type:complete len:121 (-) Transcript_74816:72-434(-)